MHEQIVSAIELAKAYWLSLNHVLSKGRSAIHKPVEAKYKNPDIESQTWTGRGRKPVWVQALLNEGFGSKDLAI